MKNGVETDERAEKYSERLAITIKKSELDSIEDMIEEKKDLILELENISLVTDNNRGVIALTKSQIEERLVKCIKLNDEIFLLEQKLKIRRKSYSHYFKNGK